MSESSTRGLYRKFNVLRTEARLRELLQELLEAAEDFRIHAVPFRIEDCEKEAALITVRDKVRGLLVRSVVVSREEPQMQNTEGGARIQTGPPMEETEHEAIRDAILTYVPLDRRAAWTNDKLASLAAAHAADSDSMDLITNDHVDQRQALAKALRERDTLKDERAEAMKVLAPNVPESGLVDACRQVKQVAISEAGNSTDLESRLSSLLRDLRAMGEQWQGDHHDSAAFADNDQGQAPPQNVIHARGLAMAFQTCSEELIARLAREQEP
jgi:hypothetical protein